jgi:hypothetical protein
VVIVNSGIVSRTVDHVFLSIRPLHINLRSHLQVLFAKTSDRGMLTGAGQAKPHAPMRFGFLK